MKPQPQHKDRTTMPNVRGLNSAPDLLAVLPDGHSGTHGPHTSVARAGQVITLTKGTTVLAVVRTRHPDQVVALALTARAGRLCSLIYWEIFDHNHSISDHIRQNSEGSTP